VDLSKTQGTPTPTYPYILRIHVPIQIEIHQSYGFYICSFFSKARSENTTTTLIESLKRGVCN